MRGAIWAAFIAVVSLCAGCASVTQGTTHSMRIETQNEAGQQVAGSNCELSNDRGKLQMRSGDSVNVFRSGTDLDVLCSSPGLPDAKARLVSRANAGMAGNILIGGGIGAIIDHNSGAAYTYPTWIRLVFGEFAVLDRKDEVSGMVLAASPGATSRVVTSAATDAALAQAQSREQAQARTQQAAANPAAPKRAAGQLARGDAFDYTIVDRMAGTSQSVTLRVDRVDAKQVVFNGGARIESPSADLISMKTAALGELDAVTPPFGWTERGVVRTGSWPVKFSSALSPLQLNYDLVARSNGEQMVRVPAGEFKATRIELEGWVDRPTTGSGGVRARYHATVWISNELKRPVRFEVRSSSSANTGLSFMVDEVTELTSVALD